MVARNGRTYPFLTPAMLGLVYSAETSFVLKQNQYVLIWILDTKFLGYTFNFFEESCSSLLAALGCFDLGITFRQPCLARTR